MSPAANTATTAKRRLFSLDGWAVFIALLAAFLVRVGAVKHIPW